MHLTPENEEQTVEGIIFYSEGEDKIKVQDQSMKQQFKEQREGLVRINVN